MDFWCGVAMTLLIETAALIAGTAWLERNIREVREDGNHMGESV